MKLRAVTPIRADTDSSEEWENTFRRWYPYFLPHRRWWTYCVRPRSLFSYSRQRVLRFPFPETRSEKRLRAHS